MSRNNGPNTLHFQACGRPGGRTITAVNTLPLPRPQRRPGARLLRHARLAMAGLLACAGVSAGAQAPVVLTPGQALPEPLIKQIRQVAQDAAVTAWPAEQAAPRIEIEVGALNPRLKLAPCVQVDVFLPSHSRPAGRTRMGLRCTKGDQAWQVSVPIEIKLWVRALVARSALPLGTVLTAQHLTKAEVDVADTTQTAVFELPDALGRTLSRGLAAGEGLRVSDLKARVWFAAGDVVTATARGTNFAISVEGKAQGPGIEGRPARIRTEDGRVITGMAVGDHRMEIPL